MQPHSPNWGFSLLEVVISLAIMALGLLGYLRLQAMSLQHSYAAFLLSVAQAQVINGKNLPTSTYALTIWNQANQQLLPAGTGEIALNNTNRPITLHWHDAIANRQLTL